MAERGIFQRGIDSIVEGGRKHVELTTSAGLIATSAVIESSPLPSPEKEIIAIPTFAAGAIIGVIGICREWAETNLRELRRIKPGIDFETTKEGQLREGIPTQVTQLGLATFTEERPASPQENLLN